MTDDNPDERFATTSGRFFGVVGVLVAVVAIGLGLFGQHGRSWTAVAFGLLVVAVSWAVFLRPRVSLEGDELVLRNMLHTRWVPVAAIEDVAVQQVLAVRAGEKRYTSVAVGRTRRQIGKQGSRPVSEGTHRTAQELSDRGYALYVEDRIRMRADDVRRELGLERWSEELDQIALGARREWAYPEIAAVVVTGLLFVLLLVL